MAKSLYSVVKNNLVVTKLFFIKEVRSSAGYQSLLCSRKINGRVVTIQLEFSGNGAWLTPPNYTFRSVTSHLDYTESEQRWTRRKDIIFSLVNILQKASVWSFITNKNFFKLNEDCKSFGKKKKLKEVVQEEMQMALNPKLREKRDKEKMKELKKKANALLKKAA